VRALRPTCCAGGDVRGDMLGSARNGAVGCRRLPISLFEPFSRRRHLQSVATGGVSSARKNAP
jgi:hypothetical protein